MTCNPAKCIKLISADTLCLPEINELYKKAITHLKSCGMHFWDFSQYPTAADLAADQQHGNLYYVRDSESGRIAACVVLNTECDTQYETTNWLYAAEKALIVHRLCVHPDFQNRGLAKTLMQTVETWAQTQGFTAIRLDAYSGNPVSLSLYMHLGFKKAGEAHWTKGMFWLMEKKIT